MKSINENYEAILSEGKYTLNLVFNKIEQNGKLRFVFIKKNSKKGIVKEWSIKNNNDLENFYNKLLKKIPFKKI